MTHEFRERLNFSQGVALDGGIRAHLLASIPLASGFRDPKDGEDPAGTDLWIERKGLPAVSVDFKHRQKDYDDILVETWSVVTPEVQKIGWTLDRSKRTDLVVYTWPTATDARRFWIAWFPFLCQAARRNYRPRWTSMFPEYKIANHHQRHGDYQTWCMYVPREEVERAMREIMMGKVRAPGAGKDGG